MQNQSSIRKTLSPGAAETLSPFIGPTQTRTLRELMRGEEGDYFVDLLESLAHRIATMPKTREQDGKGDDSIVYLHYFINNCDVWITEKDMGDGTADDRQHQAFGIVDLGFGPEWGYISLPELFTTRIELDLHWEPKIYQSTKK